MGHPPLLLLRHRCSSRKHELSHPTRLFLLLCSLLILGHAGEAQSGGSLPKPTVVVQRLYDQVIVRHPLGIPSGDNWKIFSPFLSRGLIRAIGLARSCETDWAQRYQGKTIKEPFAWGELGIFSGAEELSEPSSFQVRSTESIRDGSFRVHVRLTESPPNDKPWSWDVEVYLKMEQRRLVVDDVVFLKGDDVPTEDRLSEILKEGCKGSHWVGDDK